MARLCFYRCFLFSSSSSSSLSDPYTTVFTIIISISPSLLAFLSLLHPHHLYNYHYHSHIIFTLNTTTIPTTISAKTNITIIIIFSSLSTQEINPSYMIYVQIQLHRIINISPRVLKSIGKTLESSWYLPINLRIPYGIPRWILSKDYTNYIYTVV